MSQENDIDGFKKYLDHSSSQYCRGYRGGNHASVMPATSLSPRSSPDSGPIKKNGSGCRSRTGCWTCRGKKVKCDEKQPRCERCIRLGRDCDYTPRPRKKIGPKWRRVLEAERRRQEEQGALWIETGQMASVDQVSSVSTSTGSGPGIGLSLGTTLLDNVVLSELPHVPLSPACVNILAASDYEAIYYFRTSFAAIQHTKNPRYSVPSIIIKLAASNPMLMHMVVALAGQQMQAQLQHPNEDNQASVAHYGAAMRLMAEAVGSIETSHHLDVVLAVLWLMMLYEQRFGDGTGNGLSKHLKGAVSILRTRSHVLTVHSTATREPEPGHQIVSTTMTQEQSQLIPSLFATRMIVWMLGIDAIASSYGLGGQLNMELYRLCCPETVKGDMEAVFNWAGSLHRHTRPLFRTIWGDVYPTYEILDDLENTEVNDLSRESAQLRYMVAELASLYHKDFESAKRREKTVEQVLWLIGAKHADLLEVAATIREGSIEWRRLYSNIRLIVPHYHAVVLEFFRVTDPQGTRNDRQRLALGEIMKLAFQAHKYEGDTAIRHIAWPLLVAFLETDDFVHREWILQRFKSLRVFGNNYWRAQKLLESTITEQGRLGRRVNTLNFVGSDPLFERFVV